MANNAPAGANPSPLLPLLILTLVLIVLLAPRYFTVSDEEERPVKQQKLTTRQLQEIQRQQLQLELQRQQLLQQKEEEEGSAAFSLTPLFLILLPVVLVFLLKYLSLRG